MNTMNKKFFIYITLVTLLGLFASCEKDETRIVMLDNPVPPSLTSVPDLTLQRTNGSQTLEFKGTHVDSGFTASASYFLEADLAGYNFASPLVLVTDIQAESLKIGVSDLNGILLKKFPADKATAAELRIRSVLVVDAGTGVRGTGTNPFEYISEKVNANITPYGLPRLDLVNSGLEQKIESALGNGVYSGFVKLDTSKPFTLKDPDTNKTYGGTGDVLSLDGSPLVASASGWHKLSADVNALTYKMESYMIGLVGSATPNGWDSPDQKMDYDAKTGTWKIPITLKDGDIKFRLNDGWAWNLGGTTDKLVHNGDNIPVTAGNYTITLTITNPVQGSEAGTYTIVKN